MIHVSQKEFRTYEKIDSKSPFFDLTRLSNNNCESYFKYLKHNLLKLDERKRFNTLRLSEIAIPIHNDLEAKYIDYEYGAILNYLKSKASKKSQQSAFDMRENYFKATDYEPKYKREHGFYYKNRLELNIDNSSCGKFLHTIQTEYI